MTKLSEKLSKVNESFTLYRYDNGFMAEVGGRDEEGDWKTAKILCNTEEQLISIVKEALSLPLDS